jgi:hypothetical protein
LWVAEELVEDLLMNPFHDALFQVVLAALAEPREMKKVRQNTLFRLDDESVLGECSLMGISLPIMYPESALLLILIEMRKLPGDFERALTDGRRGT